MCERSDVQSLERRVPFLKARGKVRILSKV